MNIDNFGIDIIISITIIIIIITNIFVFRRATCGSRTCTPSGKCPRKTWWATPRQGKSRGKTWSPTESKSMMRHIWKAMVASKTPKWAETLFDTADTQTQLADVEPIQHERLDSSSDNSEVDEPKAETMTQEVDEPKADTLARAPETTFTKWDTYLFGFNSEAQKGWRLKDRNSKKEWCSSHVVPDNDDEFITGVWPDDCVKNLTVTAGEFRALQTRAAEKAGKTAKPNGPLWLREKDGITAQLSKKWDPKSGTVLLLHYKPKDFQGKNPLGSQIAQFVVHEKDKVESLAKTYLGAARKGMVEIGQRIIDGHLAPEKANEEKQKKIDHPTN